MMRSLFSGVSGLTNQQQKMDVIGNNVAGVGIHGFKRDRVVFSDMISQQLSGASRPTETLGGTNPKQVGLGMTLASIDTIHTQGSLQTTGKISDLAVQGQGFFVVKDGEQNFFTRAGVFDVDAQGTLVNPATGHRVQGWVATLDGDIDSGSDLADLVIPIGGKTAPFATSTLSLFSNLDRRELGAWEMTKEIYDSAGNTNIVNIAFTPSLTPNTYDAQVTITDAQGNALALDNPAFTASFDNNGVLVGAALAGVPIDGLTSPEGTPLGGASIAVPLTYTSQDDEVLPLNVVLGSIGDSSNSLTNFASGGSAKIRSQDGYGMGYLQDFRVDSQGMIVGTYSNGSSRVLGQVALASFTNPAGLEKVGNTSFVQTQNSGEVSYVTSGVSGAGVISAGTLEMSNVDLAEQFTEMIITQRAFQANSKTINTSDQMLEVLLSLKR